jgi:hypothetical protein
MLAAALDHLDPRRFDAELIVDRLNEYDNLSDEAHEDELNAWEYSTLAEAEHALSAFLSESHNETIVVRDLTGELMLIWEDPSDGIWQIGPLFSDHLARGESITERIERAEGALDELNPAAVERVVRELPSAPGPVVSR